MKKAINHSGIWWITLLIILGVTVYVAYQLNIIDSDNIANKFDEETLIEQAEHLRRIAEVEDKLDAAKEKGDKAEIQSAERRLAEAYGGRVGAMLNMSLDGMVEHILHGRVIDQNDQPVEGATVLTMYGNSGFMQGYGDHRLITDADGRFVSRGTGGGVTILNVLHPEITRFQTTYEAMGGGVGHGRTLTLSSANNSPENPRILRVWRVETYSDVVTFSPSEIYAPPTGEPNQDYHLRVTCIRTPYVGYRTQPSTWTMKIETVEPGGFQETQDTYLNMAPVVGYNIQSIETGFDYGTEEFKESKTFNDFYYCKSGDIYGVINIHFFKPFARGRECGVRFSFGRYNNEGGRDLAISPNLEKW